MSGHKIICLIGNREIVERNVGVDKVFPLLSAPISVRMKDNLFLVFRYWICRLKTDVSVLSDRIKICRHGSGNYHSDKVRNRAAYKMPSIPKNCGRITTNGTKQRTSLVTDEMTA